MFYVMLSANLATPTSSGTPVRSRPARIVVDTDSTTPLHKTTANPAINSSAATTTAQPANTLGVPVEVHGAANGPTRIPLSQRRVPPAKLNLTLDLSVTNLSSAVGSGHQRRSTSSSQDNMHAPSSSSAACPTSATTAAGIVMPCPAAASQAGGGVAASSGVVSNQQSQISEHFLTIINALLHTFVL